MNQVYVGCACLAVATLGFGNVARAQTSKPGWELTFNDEFTGSSVDVSKWQKRYKWGEAQINRELQAYVDDAFSFDGNVLHIVGQHSPGQYAGQMFDYRSGLIASLFHQQFGWFELRCRMPLGQGFWPAFWLLGENGTSGVNEIDIHEYLGNESNTVHMTVHWGQSYTTGHQSDGLAYIGPDFSADYHTFAVDWDTNRIIWYVDGEERFRHTGIGVPQVEMYIIANLAIGGTWPGAPDATTAFPGNYDIDYIRAYRKAATDSDAGGASNTNDAGASPEIDAAVGDTRSNTTPTSATGSAAGCGCRVVEQRSNGTVASLLFVLGLMGATQRRARWRVAPKPIA